MTFTCTLSNVKKWPIFHFIPDSVHSLCSENWKGDQGDDLLFFGGRERGRERSLQRPPWCTTRSPRPPTSASVPARLQTYWCYDPKKHALMHILIGINSQKIGQDTPRYKKTLRQSLTHLFMAWPYITLKLPCIDLPCQSREKAKEIVATRNTSTKSHLRHFTHPQPILFQTKKRFGKKQNDISNRTLFCPLQSESPKFDEHFVPWHNASWRCRMVCYSFANATRKFSTNWC